MSLVTLTSAAFAARLHRDHVLAAGEHHAADRHHLHLFDDVADHHKGVLSSLAIRRDVIRTDVVEVVDFRLRDEFVDLDGLGALERNRGKFILVDLDVMTFLDLVALDDLVRRDFLAGPFIDLAIANAIARLAIELIEADLVAICRRRENLYGTGHQRKTQEALPIGTRGHDKLLHSDRSSIV
jgi:hypothetical protein